MKPAAKSFSILVTGVFLGLSGLWSCSSADKTQGDVVEPIAETAGQADTQTVDVSGEQCCKAAPDAVVEEVAAAPDAVVEAPVAATDGAAPEDLVGVTEDSTPPPSLVDASTDTVNARLDEGPSTSVDLAPPVVSEPEKAEPVKVKSKVKVKEKKQSVKKLASISKEPVVEKAVESGEGEYVVAAGDSLGIISAKIYGTSKKWQDIAQLNEIKAPYFIFPGDVVKFKVSTAKARNFVSGVKKSMKVVVVEKGDTLAKIAEKVYGSKDAWKKFVVYNRSKISNPNKIFVGMKIAYLPHGETAKAVEPKQDEA